MTSNSMKTNLTPYHCKLVRGLAMKQGTTMSKVIALAVKEKFDSMPIMDRDRILKSVD